MTKFRGLGRGLSELINENYIDEVLSKSFINVSLDQVRANPKQPRSYFADEKIEELKDSIIQNGILQPLILTKLESNLYQIIAGERRFRAAKLANLKHVPAIIKETNQEESLKIAIIENIQRSDLRPLEEAQAYQRLIDEYNYTQETIAKEMAKSRSHIANLTRILSLPQTVKNLLNENKISLGHAKLLVNLPNSLEIAELIYSNKLSVKQTEELLKDFAKTEKTKKNHQSSNPNNYNQDLDSIAECISTNLKTKVSINQNSKNAGKITILYDDLDQFDRIIQKLTGSIG